MEQEIEIDRDFSVLRSMKRVREREAMKQLSRNR